MKGQRRKIDIHQRGFQVFVGDPFAQYWCIDFGLLELFDDFGPEGPPTHYKLCAFVAL